MGIAKVSLLRSIHSGTVVANRERLERCARIRGGPG
jgi:hypothetical protein